MTNVLVILNINKKSAKCNAYFLRKDNWKAAKAHTRVEELRKVKKKIKN